MKKVLLLSLILVFTISCQEAFAQKQPDNTEQRTYYKAYRIRPEYKLKNHKYKKTGTKKWVCKYYIVNKNDSLHEVVYFPKDTSNWEEKHKDYRFWTSTEGNTVYSNSWDGKVKKTTKVYNKIINDETVFVIDTIKHPVKGDTLHWQYVESCNIYKGWHYYRQGFKIQKLQLVITINKTDYNDPDSEFYFISKVYFKDDIELPISYTSYIVHKKSLLHHKRLYTKYIMVSGPKVGG